MVLSLIKNQVLIYFISDEINGAVCNNRLKGFDILFGDQFTGWIMWGVNNDGLCFGIDFFSYRIPVYFIPGKLKRNGNSFGSIKFYRRNIPILRRFKYSHFIVFL